MAMGMHTLGALDRGVDSLWKRVPDLVFWIFTFGSVVYLATLGGSGLWSRVVGHPAPEAMYVFPVVDGAWSPALLSYEGVGGSALALAEALAVGVALVLMFARRKRMRALGLLAVLAWSGLWAGSALMFAVKWGDPRGWVLAMAYLLPLVATSMVVVRRLRLSPPRGRWMKPRRRRGRAERSVPPSSPSPSPVPPSSRRLRLDTSEVIIEDRKQRGVLDANVA